jgi:hypothetical protein
LFCNLNEKHYFGANIKKMTIQTNQTAKHTPGPWRLSEGYLIGPNDNLIKVCLRENSSAHIKDEEVANARLIAAAPELLENLQRIIDRIEENSLQTYFPSAYERAKAAIAKATTI